MLKGICFYSRDSCLQATRFFIVRFLLLNITQIYLQIFFNYFRSTRKSLSVWKYDIEESHALFYFYALLPFFIFGMCNITVFSLEEKEVFKTRLFCSTTLFLKFLTKISDRNYKPTLLKVLICWFIFTLEVCRSA